MKGDSIRGRNDGHIASYLLKYSLLPDAALPPFEAPVLISCDNGNEYFTVQECGSQTGEGGGEALRGVP